jgi:hypothetical protein
MSEVTNLINDYYLWLKDKTVFRQVQDNWVEITTPYLDHHNDYIQIYLKEEKGQYLLTDHGDTLIDLLQTGCSLDSPKRQKLLQITLNGFGVSLSEKALEIRATKDNFPLCKHNLLQAILSVNDLFYLASSTVSNFFFEDVAIWLDANNVRYIERIKFSGKSGYDHLFDFVIPKSRNHPERIIKVLNNPSKENAELCIFAWNDTKEARSNIFSAFAILNDKEREAKPPVITALESYEIKPILWSNRSSALECLLN